MLDRDGSHFRRGSRFERIRQRVDSQPGARRIRRHRVRQRCELFGHDDDRRRSSIGDRDGVVNAPRGT